MNLKDWSDRLIWATILVTVIRYMAAFAASDAGEITGIWSNILTFFLAITGFGMGILDTVGGGLLFNGWSRVFPRSGSKWTLRFKVLTLCVVTLVVSGLIILVPFTMSRLAHESVLEALGGKTNGWAWVWSTMVNLIPYVLIAGIFTGNKMVTSLEEEKVTSNSGKVSGNLPESSGNGEKVTSKLLEISWKKLRPRLSDNQVNYIATHEPKEIVEQMEKAGYKVAPRNASNWRQYAREELNMS